MADVNVAQPPMVRGDYQDITSSMNGAELNQFNGFDVKGDSASALLTSMRQMGHFHTATSQQSQGASFCEMQPPTVSPKTYKVVALGDANLKRDEVATKKGDRQQGKALTTTVSSWLVSLLPTNGDSKKTPAQGRQAKPKAKTKTATHHQDQTKTKKSSPKQAKAELTPAKRNVALMEEGFEQLDAAEIAKAVDATALADGKKEVNVHLEKMGRASGIPKRLIYDHTLPHSDIFAAQEEALSFLRTARPEARRIAKELTREQIFFTDIRRDIDKPLSLAQFGEGLMQVKTALR